MRTSNFLNTQSTDKNTVCTLNFNRNVAVIYYFVSCAYLVLSLEAVD